MGFTGIALLMIGCMYGFVMYRYSSYKKTEIFRAQILNYELKRFMNQVVHDHNKNKG